MNLSSAQQAFIANAEQLWTNAGGDPNLAPTMAAIAAAESSFGTQLYNGADPYGGSFGWWQVNGSHPGAAATVNDPAANAALAVQVYGQQGLGAWGTWTNGAAQQVLAQLGGVATAAVPASSGGTLATVPLANVPLYAERAVVVVTVAILCFMLLGAYRK